MFVCVYVCVCAYCGYGCVISSFRASDSTHIHSALYSFLLKNWCGVRQDQYSIMCKG